MVKMNFTVYINVLLVYIHDFLMIGGAGGKQDNPCPAGAAFAFRGIGFSLTDRTDDARVFVRSI